MITLSPLLILSLHLLQQISAADSYCTPSACGIIPNISSPFRLKDDPPHCGDPSYELLCENNVASVYLSSHRYYVREINYHNFTIRLADTFMNSSSICSIPESSQIFNFSQAFSLFLPYFLNNYDDGSQLITFMTCPDLLNQSSLLIQLPDCQNSFNSSGGRHTYIEIGHSMNHFDIRYMCTIDFLVPISWNFSDLNNASLSEIHQSLLYGFELSWFRYICRHCKGGVGCSVMLDGQIVCGIYHSFPYYKWEHIMDSFRSPDGPSLGYLMIFLLLVVILFVGVSLPAKIIIGFGALYWMIIVQNWYIKDIKRIIVVIFGVRFLVGFICAMGFLIYTF